MENIDNDVTTDNDGDVTTDKSTLKELNFNNISTLQVNPKIYVIVKINNKRLPMEVDTGDADTLKNLFDG